MLVPALSLACSRPEAAKADEAGAPAVSKAAVPPVAEPPTDVIQKKSTIADAIAFTKPMMGDSTDDLDQGTVILGAWAMKKMKWPDVYVTKDETTFALVMKDSEEERGKRICVSGSIVQIEVEKTRYGKFFDGLLSSTGGNLYKFFGVGSSGDLVEKNSARFCGIATGKYEYSNSGGGTGHAVKLLGMFDLPENRAAK
jgi:hypothetical protein